MEYLDKRINVIATELKKLSIKESISLDDWQMKEGFFTCPKEADEDSSAWLSFNSKRDMWHGNDKYFWFRTAFTVPETLAGKHIQLSIASQIESIYYAMNPQFLVFLNGEVRQGSDRNHKDIFLAKEGESGKKYIVDVQAYTGTDNSDFNLFGAFQVLDEETEALYYDLIVPLRGFRRLPKESNARINIEHDLNDAVNMLDLREPYSFAYYDSIKSAREYLKRTIYAGNKHNAVTASVIGHTHIDVAWLWTVEQTKAKVARSFSTVLELMKEYPEYLFMSSQPALYTFLKDRYPALYDQVKERVREGRWEVEGGMYVEADCNLTSGESLVRQFLYGKDFFRKEFGKDNEILWLPDVFGYSAALPQIMKKSGIRYFMTTKINWNQFDRMPHDTFIWKGIDGSEILTHFITTPEVDQATDQFFTTYNGMIHADAVIGAWDRYIDKDINKDVLICYGYGDGGGGVNKEMLETATRMKHGVEGMPTVKQKFALDWFKELEDTVADNGRLATWEGELYFEYHRGTLTSMGRNKRANRKSEVKLMALELLDVLSAASHKQELDSIWKKVLLNQFHDILPGSAIKGVYDVTKKEYEKIHEELDKLVETDVQNLLSDSPEYLTIFNPTCFVRSDIAYVSKDIKALSRDGKTYPVQDGICYLENLPSKGYAVFKKLSKADVRSKLFTLVSAKKLITPFYEVELTEDGSFSRLYDKTFDREILAPGCYGNRLVMFEDKPMNYDAWDIDIYYSEKSWTTDEVLSYEWVSVGEVCAVLRVVKRMSLSTITQDIIFYADSRRIDIKNVVDWKNSQALLKVFFDTDVHTDEATFDIQFGSLKRKTHTNTSWDVARFECCGQKYVDVSEGRYGVALLNDCKYGHSVKNGKIGLSLIKSGIYPNPEADKEMHEFTYSLYPHGCSYLDSETIENSYYLNQPLLSFEGKPELDKYSLVSSDKKNVVIETIKYAEDGSGDIILRLYESQNTRTKFKLDTAIRFDKAYLVNLMEEYAQEIDSINDDKIELEIKPFEIMTIKLSGIKR